MSSAKRPDKNKRRSKQDIKQRLTEVEAEMAKTTFWNDKESAQATIREYEELKDALAGVNAYDKKSAIITIFGGAGGLDAEDFARILFEMYQNFAQSKGWEVKITHANQNDHGGFRNITFEVLGKDIYGTLRYESGVHRLVRISPFNSNKKRHTSFAMVEVTPKLPAMTDFKIDESDLEVEFSKSGGPGGQNVNKRETAVRITHKPTDISVHVDSERTQEKNRARAMELLRGKLYRVLEEERRQKEAGFAVSKTTANEWGSQIRSYVFHPYQLVKDHRTDVEVRDVDDVLDGGLEPFIQSFQSTSSN